jgi:hypothetical protein
MSDDALSFESALGLLNSGAEPEREEQEPAPATEAAPEPTESTESEAEPTAEDVLDPDEAIEGEEPGETEAPAEPAIPAPKSWAADQGEVWAKVPREAQEVILARETDRDRATQKAVQDAAEARKVANDARKAADTEVQSVTQLKAATAQVLQKADEIFKGKWDSVDWDAWYAQDPAAALIGDRAMRKEQQALAQLKTVNQELADTAERTAKAEFQRTKLERIVIEAPDLVDKDKGPARVAKLESFLETNGIAREVFGTLDAFTIGLAYDGMRFREAQKTAPKPTPAPARAAVRPTAAQPVRSPQRAAQEAKTRFDKTLSLDDALAVLDSRK